MGLAWACQGARRASWRGGTHVDGGDDGDGLPGDVHPGKDGGGLADARQPLCQQLRGQIVQLQVEVVLPTRDALILERYMWESTTNPSVKKSFSAQTTISRLRVRNASIFLQIRGSIAVRKVETLTGIAA